MLPYEHFLIVLGSPSGSGKSTLCKMIMERDRNLKFSTSATTRPKRKGEVDGVDYYFLSQDEFDKRVAAGEFLEHAGVYERSYGTLKSDLEGKMAEGCDVILDLDWRGNLALKEQITDKRKLLSICLLPPSIDTARKRLRVRDTETPEEIEKRMLEAKVYAKRYAEYDYMLVAGELPDIYKDLRTIIDAKRLENRKHDAIEKFIDGLLKE
jgi:guanylate kinase